MSINSFSRTSKFNDNFSAIKLVKNLEKNNQLPTIEEKELLKQYIGWGSLAVAFPNSANEFISQSWKDRNEQLQSILTSNEYANIQASITDAFFTPSNLISSMWKIAQRLDANKGIILEPSCGIGKFLYEAIDNDQCRFIGIEKDPISSKIATQINSNNSCIFEYGFEDVPLIENSVDLVIGNPPYGDFSLFLKDCSEYNSFSIHNQFILKSLKALKNNQYGIFVVSRYVLDSVDKSARKSMAYMADLVAACRLPSNAFKSSDTVDTEVITDILVFKKCSQNRIDQQRVEYGIKYDYPEWVNSSLMNVGFHDIAINDYYHTNTAHILGSVGIKSGQFGNTLEVHNESLDQDLQYWIDSNFKEFNQCELLNKVKLQADFDALVAHLYIELSGKEIGVVNINESGELYRIIEQDIGSSMRLKMQTITPNTVWSDKYTFHVSGEYYEKLPLLDEKGNKVYEIKENGLQTSRIIYEKVFISDDQINARSKLGKTRFDKLNRLIQLRDHLNNQLILESQDAPELKIENNRLLLNKLYESFVKKYSFINAKTNATLIGDLPDAGLILALESEYKKAVTEFSGYTTAGKKLFRTLKPESAEKAAILNQRVIFKQVKPTSAETPEEALTLSMSYKGGIDLDYMADLLGVTQDEVIKDLHSETPTPLMYFDPTTDTWVHQSIFLSGNVRQKLKLAQSLNNEISMSALEKVLPEKISLENISISLGMTWIPQDIHQNFIKDITGDNSARIFYESISNTYDVTCSPIEAKEALYSTEAITFKSILEHIFNNRTIRIVKTEYCPILRTEKSVFDPEATELAINSADNVKQVFLDWLYQRVDDLNLLEDIYNNKFNSFVSPKFETANIVLNGKVPDSVITLRQHQKNAIYRGVVSNFSLYNHVVGAGKSFVCICRAMLRKQMGLTKKSIIVVPNHLVIQMASDVYRLFPSAKVLAATPKDFQKKNRKRLFAKIATGDYDIVVMAHSSFEFIKLSDSIQDKFIQDQLNIINDALISANLDSDKRKSAKALANMKKRLEKKLSSGMNTKREDKLITFDLLGVNNIEVDEFHAYKNLQYFTNLSNIVGMGNPQGSYRAFDMYIKFLYLHSINGSAGCYTGTPISNSAVELYNLKRFLVPKELNELGLDHFDSWQRLFTENSTKFEATYSGKLKQVTRLAREWRNLSSLMGLWSQFTDSISNDDLNRIHYEEHGCNFPIPDIKNGGRETIVCEPTYEQQDLINQLLERYDNLENISDIKERGAERLRLMDFSRKLSLSARCVNSERYAKEQGGKLQSIADKVFSTYQEWDELKGTQLIFLDRSVPKSKDDLKIVAQYDKLIQQREEFENIGDEVSIQIIEDRLDSFNATEIEALREANLHNWSAYQEIKDLLVKKGMDSKYIRFIQEAKNDQEKQDLFDLINSGEIRVLIGSTSKMGAGTNCQRRLVALHHADISYTPSSITQREGRILRQGNELYKMLGSESFQVGIYCYVTELSSDARMWELNSNKLKMINSLQNYNGQHSIDFGDDADALNMKEIAALATGNPLFLERVELEAEIQQIERLRVAFMRKQASFTVQVSKAEKQLKLLPERLQSLSDSALNAFAPMLEESILNIEKNGIIINGEKYSNCLNALDRIKEIKSQKIDILTNNRKISFTKAQEYIKDQLFNRDTPFHFKNTHGDVFDSPLLAAIEIERAIKYGKYDYLGDLFGLPLQRDHFGMCNLYITTLDEKFELTNCSISELHLTISRLSIALKAMVKEIENKFSNMGSEYEKDRLNAEQIIKQLSPELSYKFKQEPELKYKKLRLGMLQTALISEDSISKLNSLMDENKAEIDALIEQCNSTKISASCIGNLKSEVSEIANNLTVKTKPVQRRKSKTCALLINGEMKKALQLDLF